MSFVITSFVKIDDKVSRDRTSMNFSGGVVTTFYTSRGTFELKWRGVIDRINGVYLNGRHVADLYEEYHK